MLHLLPLPGDPSYDEVGGIEKVLNRAMHDLEALQNGGVDGVLISNEFSLHISEALTHRSWHLWQELLVR